MTTDPQALKPAENHLFSFNVDNFEPSPERISCFLVAFGDVRSKDLCLYPLYPGLH